MGIFGQVQRQFIARPDAGKGQILYKWPDQNIRKFTQLTVEQDELAVFFRDGRVQGTIQPGRVTLDSSDIPFLGALVDAATGGNLFRTELYFISTREFAGGSTFVGDGAYAGNRAQMLAGNPNPTVISFLVPPSPAYAVGDGILPADLDGVTLVRMENGKIAEERDFFDNLEFSQQLGLIPR